MPALLTGAFLGWFCQVFVQGDQVSNAIIALTDGYSIETGNKLVDELFNRGGIEDMMYTVSLTIVAMSFAGIMESTGMLEVILNKIMKVAKSAKSLIPITEFSSFSPMWFVPNNISLSYYREGCFLPPLKNII